MQLLIVTFNLNGVSDSDYRAMCRTEASAFASIDGMLSKTWIADEATNTYGGVYAFDDRKHLEAYLASDLFASIGQSPGVANLATATFDVLEEPSRVTHAHLSRAA